MAVNSGDCDLTQVVSRVLCQDVQVRVMCNLPCCMTPSSVAVLQENDIVAALMDLFQALSEKEQQQIGGAVDPNPLREALSSFMDFVTGRPLESHFSWISK